MGRAARGGRRALCSRSSGNADLARDAAPITRERGQNRGLVDALSSTENAIDALLLELAEDERVAVVCDAAQILGRRESARAVPTLKALTQHADDNVALAAVEALGRIGGKEALESLLVLAESRNFFRTFPTIDILGRSGDSRALKTLLALSVDPLYGAEAVRALGRLGDPSAVSSLLESTRPRDGRHGGRDRAFASRQSTKRRSDASAPARPSNACSRVRPRSAKSGNASRSGSNAPIRLNNSR